VQVELDVQNCFYESSPEGAVNSGDASLSLITITWETWFHRWLEMLESDLPTASGYEIGLRLTNDVEIQTLNFQFRHQDKPTDVLSFAALEVDLPQNEEMLTNVPLYLGDIVISVDTAQRQAQQQEHSLLTELAWLAAHGLLHLLGWDHPDEDSLMVMLEKQVKLLKAIGITVDIE
jgi:probable rRNA maturation factor